MVPHRFPPATAAAGTADGGGAGGTARATTGWQICKRNKRCHSMRQIAQIFSNLRTKFSLHLPTPSIYHYIYIL